ncbi:MAG TPA: hypothetical protein VNA22_01755, partial [Pyrinomonadaceae bacterium]|nr:hypothetical protein [Pyrinomonadaceae bacterium]
MKRCPKCHLEYPDDTLNFCLEDGETLISGDRDREPPTAIKIPDVTSEAPTRHKVRTRDRTEVLPTAKIDRRSAAGNHKVWIAIAVTAA